MARTRTIKPETFDDPELCALPALTRWLFVGLWTQADREGRLRDEPQRLKTRLLPYDPRADVDAMLTALATAGLVIRYEVAAEAYIQIRSFTRHQPIHPAEKKSEIPPPNDDAVKLQNEPCNSRRRNEISPSSTSTSSTASTSTSEQDAPPGDGFAVFWEEYPRKVAKPKAEQAWRRLKPSADVLTAILAALLVQRRSEDWRKEGGKYIPYPERYLKDRRWEDEVPRVRGDPPRVSDSDWQRNCQHTPTCGMQARHEELLAIEAEKARQAGEAV